MKHELHQLPYPEDALEPYMSAETLQYHHGKHVQAYINNLNNLIPGTPFEDASLEDIIRKADGGIFNNGAQVWNHRFFFEGFSPRAKHKPEGRLAEAIDRAFGSLDRFREEFAKTAVSLFGSGWAWLVKDREGNLQIVPESNAGNPLRRELQPVMTCDVWEHAYYIDYRNRRPDFVKAFWDILDWERIEERYEA